jgi:hypothetical protein
MVPRRHLDEGSQTTAACWDRRQDIMLVGAAMRTVVPERLTFEAHREKLDTLGVNRPLRANAGRSGPAIWIIAQKPNQNGPVQTATSAVVGAPREPPRRGVAPLSAASHAHVQA